MNHCGKYVVAVADAPKPIGPYSQAVKANGFLFVSGQIPIDLATGDLIQGDVADQARQDLRHISAILAAAGVTLHHVVRTTIYLIDMADFPKVNAVYSEFFTDEF